jgi:hypothetical protein
MGFSIGLETQTCLEPRYVFFEFLFTFTNIYLQSTMTLHHHHNEGQRQSMQANEDQSRPTTANKGLQQPTNSHTMTGIGPNDVTCQLGPGIFFFFFFNIIY